MTPSNHVWAIPEEDTLAEQGTVHIDRWMASKKLGDIRWVAVPIRPIGLLEAIRATQNTECQNLLIRDNLQRPTRLIAQYERAENSSQRQT
jgi:hypothetical protein